MKIYYLTTIDNEFDPENDFDNWNNRDNELGYGTISILARLSDLNESASDYEKIKKQNEAAKKIIENDILGVYKLIEGSEEIYEDIEGQMQ